MRYDRRLRQLRIEHGYSKEKLAKILHIDVEKVENWEEGVSEPSIRELYQLSALYEVNINEILDHASLYMEMEQATQLTADNKSEYIVGATGTNNDEIDSLDFTFDKELSTHRIQDKKQKESVNNSPPMQKSGNKQFKFWITVVLYTAIISLFGILPAILLKNRFWAFLSLLPVLVLGIWGSITKDRKNIKAVGIAILFAALCIVITIVRLN